MNSILISIFTLAMLVLVSTTSHAAPIVIMYGGLGGHANGDSINDGALAIVNQATAAVSIVGHPAGVARLSGLEFDSTGALFGATQNNVAFPPPTLKGPSNLVRLDPLTGATLYTVAIKDATGREINIADLAVQPGTNILFGISSDIGGLGAGELFTIDKITGLATLVGTTDDFFASIAFAPDGTLYMFAQTLTFGPNGPIFGPPELEILNPSNAAELSAVPTSQFYGAFGIRPTDGVLFAGNGDGGAGIAALFTVNPNTGVATLIGPTGRNFIGDLAFQVVPEPGTLVLLGLGLAGLGFSRRKKA